MNTHRLLLVLFVGAYMTAAMVLAVLHWNYEFIYYGVVMLGLIAAVVYLDRRVALPAPVLWGLGVWGFLHMLGGTMPIPWSITEPPNSEGLVPPPVLYNMRIHPMLPKYDQCVHAFGFFISTLAAWRALSVASRGQLRASTGPLLGAGLVGMGLGAMNEVIEFAATRIMPGTNVGGYDNTGWDLVSNMTGCVAAAIVIRARAGGAVDASPGPL